MLLLEACKGHDLCYEVLQCVMFSEMDSDIQKTQLCTLCTVSCMLLWFISLD